MYENLIPIASLIISIFAVVFTVIGVGFSFTLGFREKEETSKKRKETKQQLVNELEGKVTKFLDKNREKKKIDKEMMKELMNLSLVTYATNLADDLLENMTYYGNRFLKLSAFTLKVIPNSRKLLLTVLRRS